VRRSRFDAGVEAYSLIQQQLTQSPKRWLVTGAAGFIGSHLTEKLLALGQQVVAVDNLATGLLSNVEAVRAPGLEFHEADVGDLENNRRLCEGVDYVLHQAGLGSVPRSIKTPWDSHAANVTGTLHLMTAAKDAGVKRFVYASSSSVYGDDQGLPKIESRTGRPLSPYAATKAMCETYAGVFHRCYGLSSAGLRYFNVFGPRQDPNGPYAAVMPLWFAALSKGERCVINGDGSTSRDFCYVANVVQANILAATSQHPELGCDVFNVACGQTTSLNDLYGKIRTLCGAKRLEPDYRPFRSGDILHSLADISYAKRLLGYEPTHDLDAGLKEAAAWYLRKGQ
jgi:UDP-N-acetylglucosamine/UDP-N-acetylgalactosamine 4-epimerase